MTITALIDRLSIETLERLLCALMRTRDGFLRLINPRMREINEVLARKRKHWLEVGRFEGWTQEQREAFDKLRQGVSLSSRS